VTARTARIRAGRPARLRFTLDKISRVGLTVRDSAGRTVFATSAVVGRGSRYFNWSRPTKAGRYTLTATATDLTGNTAEPSERPLRVLRKRR
jgi:Big-like domain-containing protein